MERVYTAAVIGAGTGGGLSMAALAASPRFELTAVADTRPAALEAVRAHYPGVQTYTSHEALFAACPTDIVCVSTWPPSHLEITRAALRQPLKGILVEKPLADNARDGRAVLAAVQAAGLPMVTPHNLLVLPHALEIIARVRQGEIGALRLVEIECGGWDIINAGIHWLHFCVMLAGDDAPQWVLAGVDKSTRTYRDGMQVETMAITYVQFASGLRVVMQTGDDVQIAEPGKGLLFRLVGTAGTIEFYAWEPRYRLLNAARPHGELFEVPVGARSGHQRHLENLAAQMDAGQPDAGQPDAGQPDAGQPDAGQPDAGQPDYAIPAASLTALELCEAAYLSGRLGCLVTLPLAAFAPPAPVDWSPGQPYGGAGGGRNGRELPAR